MRDSVSEQLAEDEETEINLTPMLDVVFIMLIFFIVTSVFVKEPGVDVTRPFAATAEIPRGGSIFVAITGNNEVWLDHREIEITNARAAIERLHSENPESGIVIQADNDSRTGVLVQVMDAARLAGVYDVAIAAREPGL